MTGLFSSRADDEPAEPEGGALLHCIPAAVYRPGLESRGNVVPVPRGFTFFCTGSIWCTIVALYASSVADTLRERPRVQTGFDLFTAVLFVALGVGLFLSHR
jgi:threonine/homoserine/homoserine lactone efflux protein